MIESSNRKTLLINTYFPLDKREAEHENNDNSDELVETLAVINNVIRDNDCDAVFWTGDINADFNRNTHHSKTVKEAVDDLNFSVAWDHFKTDFTAPMRRRVSPLSSGSFLC